MSFKLEPKRNQFVVVDILNSKVVFFPTVEAAGGYISNEINENAYDVSDFALIDLGSNGKVLDFGMEEVRVSEPEYEYLFHLL